MSSPRLNRAVKGRILLYLLIGAFILCYVYFNESKHEDDMMWQTEKDTLQRQLQVLIDYKSRMERSLAEERGAHLQYLSEAKSHLEEDKERQAALKQHFKLLQGQFNDLSEECNKIKNLNQGQMEGLEKIKEKYLQEKIARENLQHQLNEKCNGEEDLKKQLAYLQKENHMLKTSMKKEQESVEQSLRISPIPTLGLKHISKQIASSDGVYYINITNKTNGQIQKPAREQPKMVIVDQAADSGVLRNPYEETNLKGDPNKANKSTSKITPKLTSSTKAGAHGNIPAGVVPVANYILEKKNEIKSSSPNLPIDNHKSNSEPKKSSIVGLKDNEINADNEVNFNRYESKIDQLDLEVKNHKNMEAAIAEIQKENSERLLVNPEKKGDTGDIHLEENRPLPPYNKVGENEKAEPDLVPDDGAIDNDFHDLNNSPDLFDQANERRAQEEDDDDAEYMAPQNDI